MTAKFYFFFWIPYCIICPFIKVHEVIFDFSLASWKNNLPSPLLGYFFLDQKYSEFVKMVYLHML